MKILWRVAKEAKQYRLLLILAALSTLLLTGVNLIAPKILSIMTGLVADGVSKSDLTSIFEMMFALLALYLLKILFRFLSNYCAHFAAWKLVQNIRIKVYSTLQSFPIDYYRNKQTGELISRVINDTATFELIYAHLLTDTIINFVTLGGVTIILFYINTKLAFMTCIPIPFILVSTWFFLNKVRPNYRAMQKSMGELSAQLQDNFTGMHEIQAFSQQKTATIHVHKKAERFTISTLRALKLSAVFHPSVEFLTALGTVIVVGFGGYLAYLQQVTVENIVAFLLYLSLFYAPITSIAQFLESSQQALAGAERIIEILDTPVNIKDSPKALPIKNASGSITFSNVNFSYIHNVPVLKDINFEIKPGQMVALVGATGVGKSTITQLISRFYDPTDGDVFLDGHNLKDITLESVHKSISVVLQDTFLFNGTISENIAFAIPNADQEEIEKVAHIARIHDEIMEMPDGYKTQVGERGTKLSGGQKQRIAIARAILCKAPILILDEATASVDVHTETQIQQAINEIVGTRTIIAIAHRLSTIRHADIILVFKDGAIVEKGNHNELIALNGLYKKMCMEKNH